ncbi:MAG: DUF3024 domain-containing protein [Clostridiales bacterium]|nr:DUF3024 domain-containing protein [Clostridiales bacterium]
MLLSEFTKKLVETKLKEYCERRIPIDIRDQVKLIFKVMRDKVTLIETRPYFRDPSIWTETPIAQFRFDNKTDKWKLYCMDGNSRWHLYDLIKPSVDFDDMLKALDNDRTGIFWG